MAQPAQPAPPAPLPDTPQALLPGTRFGDLEIVRTLGVGGFGIVYLARDHALQRMVAIKEYMPGELAHRLGSSQVLVRSSTFTETFDTGRRSFVHEARLLARFDHRSLLKVYQFWEANGTAYMVMPYLSGQTLKQARQAMARPPSEAWLLRVLLPLLDALERLHAESVLHRDISPDNILLPDDGADPILLDFGAARRAIGDHTQAITAILKPRFAPIEQYGESRGLRQGPWTDLYALGAVMHYLVLGRTPPQATTRAVCDEHTPLAGQALGLSPGLLAAIDWSLRVHPQDRPQTATEMRAVVQGARAAPPASAPPAPVQAAPVSAAQAHAVDASAERPTVVVPMAEHVKTIQIGTAPVPPRRLPVGNKPWHQRHRALAWGLSAGGVLVAMAIVIGLWPRPAPRLDGRVPREDLLPDPSPAAAAVPAQPASGRDAAVATPPRREAKAVPPRAAPESRTQPVAPSAACAGANVFTRWRCIEVECAKPALAGHPECASLQAAPAGRREGTRNAN